MTLLKQYFVPTLTILLAGLIVSLAAVPLQNTEWAEGFRVGISENGADAAPEAVDMEGAASSEDGQEGDQLGSLLMVIGPLIKVTILMGIGGLLTMVVLWMIGRIKRRKVR